MEREPPYVRLNVLNNGCGSCYWEDGGEGVLCTVKGPREFARNVCYDGLTIQVYVENVPAAKPAQQTVYRRYEGIVRNVLRQLVAVEDFPLQQVAVVLTMTSDGPTPLHLCINAAVVALLLHGLPLRRFALATPVDARVGDALRTATLAFVLPQPHAAEADNGADNGGGDLPWPLIYSDNAGCQLEDLLPAATRAAARVHATVCERIGALADHYDHLVHLHNII